ncbi:MgtC/SapB family protein [Kozakia baliensis]|uniref:MgtC/SapB family protein n=1 Tax=Kozakia baliensis TaxID=153496 RepID=UPI000495BF65|nr:MgtC/SapB family protein [Kozakia baliensis]
MHPTMPLGSAAGQGWQQLGELLLAFVLSAFVGLEREYRQKSAGFRTYTLVGVASALFVLVSKYGFNDVLLPERIILDPSRVAAQVVSGLGFIGGGVIFMRRDTVRGLTTAASVWLTAALGMACGAGLTALALLTMAGYLFIMFVTPHWLRHFPRSKSPGCTLVVVGQDDAEFPDRVQALVCERHFTIGHVRLDRMTQEGHMALALRVRGKPPYAALANALARLEGVLSVRTENGGNDME